MRYLILFCVSFLIVPPAQAQSTKEAPPPIRAFLEFCLPPIAAKEDPADFALKAELLEFAPDQAKKFAPQGGRVFAIPYAKGEAVLMTNNNHKGMCSIAVRKTDKAGFDAALDKWFGPKTPFKLIREKRMDDERVTRREYGGNIKGRLTFLVSLSDVPRENGMQALMTLARDADSP
jgi:hypothetical protein